MKLQSNRTFWRNTIIAVCLILTAFLVVSYQLQAQKRNSLGKEISDIKEQSAMLADTPIPDSQRLSYEYASLQRDISYQKANLNNAVGSNGIETLVSIARKTSVELVNTKSMGIRTVTMGEIPYNMITLQLQVTGGVSELMSFIEKVSRELGVIQTLAVDVPEAENGTFTANIQVNIHSYIE